MNPLTLIMKTRKVAATFWIVIGAFLSACGDRKDPPAAEGRTITSLTIRHTTPKLVQDRQLLRFIRSQPGTTCSDKKIDEDVKTVFESGLVDDVSFSVKPGGDSVQVIATVSTRRGGGPGFSVVGNTKFSEQMLWMQISQPHAIRMSRAMTVVYDLETDEPIIYRDEGLVSEVLPAVCDELENFYRSAGFPNVKVRTRSRNTEVPTESDFLFVIEENAGEN